LTRPAGSSTLRLAQLKWPPFKDDEQQAADAEGALETATRDALAAVKALMG
jgi:hypothetical protein